jgi:hypothetical protein
MVYYIQIYFYPDPLMMNVVLAEISVTDIPHPSQTLCCRMSHGSLSTNPISLT